jgi:hypothetical protein
VLAEPHERAFGVLELAADHGVANLAGDAEVVLHQVAELVRVRRLGFDRFGLGDVGRRLARADGRMRRCGAGRLVTARALRAAAYAGQTEHDDPELSGCHRRPAYLTTREVAITLLVRPRR